MITLSLMVLVPEYLRQILLGLISGNHLYSQLMKPTPFSISSMFFT